MELSWTTQSSAADNQWWSVTWAPELGLLVAVAISGTGNRVMTSPDGINWTIQSSAADLQWLSVTWAAELGLLVAVSNSGTGNRVMTSPDGITWTTQSSAADNDWRSVIWAKELGLLVAVARTGVGNRVMTSPDGINWSIRSSPADNEWYSITWSKELGILCSVSINGTDNRVMSSALYPFEEEDRTVMQLGEAPLLQNTGSEPLFPVRSWVNFDGFPTVPEIRNAGNISSIDRLGVGDYRLNFIHPMPDTSYSIVAISGGGGAGRANQAISIGTMLQANVRIFNADLFTNSIINSADINVIVTI
jgi:hypothetical protein